MQSDDADNKTQTSKPPGRTRKTEAKYKSRSLPTSLTSMGGGHQSSNHVEDRSVNTNSSGTSLIRLYRAGSVANKGGRRPKSLRSVSEDSGGSGSESASLSMLLNSVANSKGILHRPKQQEQHSTHPHQQQKQQDPHPRDQHQLYQIDRHFKHHKQRVENDSGGSSDNNHFSSSASSCPSCGSSSVEDNAAAVQASAGKIRQLSPVSETGGVLHNGKNHGPIKSPGKGSKNKMRRSTSENRINEKNPNNLTRRLNTVNAVVATMGATADLDNQSISSMPSLASYNSESHRSMPSLASFNSESMRSRKSTSMMSTTSSYSMDTPSDDSFSSLVTNDSSICSFSQYSVFSSKSNAPRNNAAVGSTDAAAAAAGGGGASSSLSTAKSNVASATAAAAAVKGGTNNNNNNAVLVNKSNSSRSGSSVSSSNNSRIMTRFVGGIRARNVSVPVPSNADVVAGKTLDYIESAPVKQPKKEEEQEKRKQRWGGTRNKVDAVPMAIVRKGSQQSPIIRSKSDSNCHHGFSLTRKDVSKGDLIPQLARRRSSKEYYEALQQQQQRNPKRDALPQLARRRSSKEYEEQQQASPPPPPPPRSRDVLPNIVRRRGSHDDHDVVRDDIETMIQKINI